MKKLNVKESWPAILGMAASIGAVVVGIVLLANYKQYYGSMRDITFGADFYTEIYGATAGANNALRYIYEMLRIALGTFLSAFGFISFSACFSRLKYSEIESATAESCSSVKEEDEPTK